ncbi:hypothetical protein AB0L59_06825 [Streptomyces sp. NPDC052109]|uniref:hypothetical protein n=1 Tax=Streptomyces sp. NPDC052109 TaxID=3155527 RepID=UPI00341B8443
MTFPAALLGATVRVLRTAAGRRALQLALLVGGLFLLGFLCGEQAHAADGTPATASSARSAGTGPEGPVQAVDAVRTATERVVTHVHTVGEQAVVPVRDVLSTVTRTVETTATRAAGTQPRPAALPLPGLARVPHVPARPTPEPASTVRAAQRHGGAVAFAPAERTQRHARARARAVIVDAPASTATYGPVTIPAPQPEARTLGHHGAAAAGAPGRPAPTPDPDGVLGKQAVDGSATRHGDAHAVTLDDRAPLRLTPGPTARADAPSTRERLRDVPVFPG